MKNRSRIFIFAFCALILALPCALADDSPVWYSTTVANYLNEEQFMIYFGAKGGIRRLFYCFAGEKDFHDLGLSTSRHPETGEFLPNLTVYLPFSDYIKLMEQNNCDLVIYIKYINNQSVLQGPFPVHFNGVNEVVTFVKSTLQNLPDWVAITKSPTTEGQYLAYFTPLLSYRYGLKKIEYSLDEGKEFRQFPIAEKEEEQQYYFEVPEDINSILVRVTFLNDEISPVNRSIRR